MRKDVKLVVAAACILLIGLLAYVLFAPSHNKGAVAEEGAAPTDNTTTPQVTAPAPAATQAPPVSVAVEPTSQPAAPTVTVALTPTTQPSAFTGGPATPVLPATDSNVPAASTAVASTDWDKTLTTGSVSTAAGYRQSLPTNSLIAATEAPQSGAPLTGSRSASAGPSTRPAPALGNTAAATAGGKTHKVAFGETLSSIAADYYGNKANYTKIVAANPSINPNRLKVGTVLTIPELKESKADAVTEVAGADKPTLSSGTSYAVKSGDSLQKIASKLYGSSDKWQKIYDLNRAAIGADPHRLRAGMVLKLPEAPTSASAAAH